MFVLVRFLVVGLVALGAVATTTAVHADAKAEKLDFSGCFAVHEFDVCAEITGVRHQTTTPSGAVVTGFTEFSCFELTAAGAFHSRTCTAEHNAAVSKDGFLTMIHDSGWIAFTDGVRSCSARFLLQIVNGQVIPASTELSCP